MLGERPLAEYGIAITILGALVFIVRALLAHFKYVHDTTQKGNGCSDVIMRADIKGLKTQMNEMYKTWTPERGKQQDKIHDYLKESAIRREGFKETMTELLKESRKMNGLMEKFIALNTQEHNIIIRDIKATQKPWENQFNKE